MSDLLQPYVPRLAVAWLAGAPQQRHRRFPGSLAFVDVSGFTALTERLATRGKAGAEEMGEYLDSTFDALLDLAYEYGAGLVKWGGDATLLLFTGDDHAARASRAAWLMSRAMPRVGRLRTSVGRVALRVSIGVASGEVDAFLLGTSHRELVLTGPVASATARMEAAANAGEVVVSPATAALLDPGVLGPVQGGGRRLVARPAARPQPAHTSPEAPAVDLGCLLPPPVRAHLRSAADPAAHRPVTAGFVQVTGVDALLEQRGGEEAADALSAVVEAAGSAADRHGVTFLEVDVAADGGKVILLGGAPVAYGNDEERVLRAARQVLDVDAGPLRLRAGVNAGRVYVGGFGPSYRRTWSVAGDAVNLAARLMATAQPGQLLTTPAVLARSRTPYAATPLPPFAVKGKKDPVTAVVVGGALRRAAADSLADLEVVGREAELAVLTDAVSTLASGRGAVVEVVGDPGMGKSRLVHEALATSPVPVLELACDDCETTTPYLTARRLLLRVLGLAEDDASAGPRLRVVVDDRAPALGPWLPLLQEVLGLPPDRTPEVDALEARFRPARTEQVVVELLAALPSGPVVLVLEDAHAVDASSAGVLARLAAEVQGRPWLLVVTRRPTGTPVALPAHARTVRLGPLTPQEASRLARSLEGEERPLTPHEHGALVQRSGGNPLFLRELVHARASGTLGGELPDSVETLLAAALDRLPAADRRVLSAAAVLGPRSDVALLWSVLDDDVEELDRVLTRLSPFVVRDGETGLRFLDRLVRDVAYECLPFRVRRALHRRAGEALERLSGSAEEHAALLASHFFHAEQYEAAWRYACTAAARAAALYANTEALDLYGRALAAGRRAGADAAALARLHQALGDVAFRLGEFGRADAAYRAARPATAEPVARARLDLKLAQVAEKDVRWSLALRRLTIARCALRGATTRDAVETDARLVARYAYGRFMTGDHAGATRWCQEALRLAGSVGADGVVAETLTVVDAVDMARGRFGADTDAGARRALRLYEQLGDLPWQAKVHNQLGMRAYYEGRWTDAVTCYRRARELWERTGDTWHVAYAQANLGEILLEQGVLDEAANLLDAAERVWRAAGTASEVSFVTLLRGRLAARTGRLDEADALLERALQEFREQRDEPFVLETRTRLAECLVLRRDAEAAMLAVDSCLADAGSTDGASALQPLLHRVRACALYLLGRPADAGTELERSLGAAVAASARHEEAFSLDALARLATGDGDAGRDDRDRRRDDLLEQLGVAAPPSYPWTPAVPLQVGPSGDGDRQCASLGS